MESKLFELRAPSTCIVIMATKLDPSNEAERYLLSRSGFGRFPEEQQKYIFVHEIDGGNGKATTDPYEQSYEELRLAHIYIRDNFDKLIPGQVIDIEFINGTTDKPKISESEEDLFHENIDWKRKLLCDKFHIIPNSSILH